jgi:PAS domain S-box-containing protein
MPRKDHKTFLMSGETLPPADFLPGSPPSGTKSGKPAATFQTGDSFSSDVLANSPTPMMVINPDTSVKYVNPAFEQLTGFSTTEITGKKPPFPWWPQKERIKLARDFEQALHTGLRGIRERFTKKNGDEFWVKKTFVPVVKNGECQFYLGNWIDITRENKLEANLRYYLSELHRAQEEESRRLALELHDGVLQALTRLGIDVDEVMVDKKVDENITQQLSLIRSRIMDVMGEIRRVSRQLRPAILDKFGLVPALEMLIDEIADTGRIKCNFSITGNQRRLPAEAELQLFRIAQEALNNVMKHSHASNVDLAIDFRKTKVKLRIADDGDGFELPTVLSDLPQTGKLGLTGLAERTRLLNGQFDIETKAGEGTEITVTVPVS